MCLVESNAASTITFIRPSGNLLVINLIKFSVLMSKVFAEAFIREAIMDVGNPLLYISIIVSFDRSLFFCPNTVRSIKKTRLIKKHLNGFILVKLEISYSLIILLKGNRY